MKHSKSRVLAIFLCLLMVFTLLPVSAFAEEANKETVYVGGSSANDSSGTGDQNSPVKTLSKALEKVKDGGTIILTEDANGNENNSTAVAIGKSVTIKSDDNSKRTLTVKTLNISGTGKTVTLENLKITRDALSVTNDQGDGVYAIVAVGFNNNSALDSTTPTVNIKDCEISISGSVAQQGSDNIQTAALRVGSGTVTVEDSTIKNDVTVTKVAAEAIQIDTASSGGDNATRSLTITGNSNVECTNGSGVLFTTTTKNATLAVNGGTVKAIYCINYAGAASNTVTVGQGVTLEGWSAVTVRGSGLTATITDATIKSENKQTDGANNYAVFAFESGNNNTVNVSGGSISAGGGASNSLSQYLASFYEGSNNSLEIKDSAEVTVENNKNDKWITYKQNPSTAGDYTPSNGNGTVKIGDDVTLQTGDGEDASFVVKDNDGNIVNVTEKFNSAVELVKDETSGVKEGSTIVVGADATIEGDSAEVPAGLTVDVTKNKAVAQQVKPATGVIVVYGITDGDKTEDKSFDSSTNAPKSTDVNIKSAGFKAKAADATSVINAALTEDKKGPVSDVSDNTVYIILDHRVAGTSFKVKVDKDGGVTFADRKEKKHSSLH